MTIGTEQLQDLTRTLQKYKGDRARTESRIKASEQWWKMRNSDEERKSTEIGKDGGFTSRSAWLHNIITSKHADYIESYPEPNILPRGQEDKAESQVLSAIIPCILDQNDFENTYSEVGWQKLKTGTGLYKVTWNQNKLNGLGDISIEKCNLLDVYFEAGVKDIQRSRYVFHTELCDKDLLIERYPELEGKLNSNNFVSSTFLYDDTVDTENKATVIDCYYKKRVDNVNTLQYIKYVGDNVLYATENDPETAERGLYDHGLYPYVFDSLFPIEGSPYGYGYVDIEKTPQTEIDLFNTAFVKNAMAGAIPRYFRRNGSGVNEEEFLDTSKPIISVEGNVSEESLRPIDYNPLNGVYVNVMDRIIDELRQTSGNTEAATGNATSGVTAASAIAALQEASGKGSRDSTMTSYRAYSQIINLVIELIRQFYDMPRQFRIMGEFGAEKFMAYTNQRLKLQESGDGFRLPVFDIKVVPQRRNVYSKISQNELALQFYQLGFFNPQNVDQALTTIGMMEFDGKDAIMSKISENGTMFQKLAQYMNLSLTLAQMARPELVDGLSQDIMQTVGGNVPGGTNTLAEMPNGEQQTESTRMQNARARSNNASQIG